LYFDALNLRQNQRIQFKGNHNLKLSQIEDLNYLDKGLGTAGIKPVIPALDEN